MRIGYLVQQFPPEVGAGPARVTEMAAHWIAAGAEVRVFTGMPNRPEGRIHAAYRRRAFMREQWEGIDVRRSWLYASPRPGFAHTLLNNLTFMGSAALTGLRGGDVDVLIASSPPFLPHVTGAVLGALRRVPLVLEIRDLWPDYLVGMGVLKPGHISGAIFGLERRLLLRAAHSVVVTESFRRRIIEKGTDADRVDVIPNGVDLGFYHPADEPPPLPSLIRADGERIIGYLGNFGAGQALANVLRTAALLRDLPLRFVLAGDGPDRAVLTSTVAELGLTNVAIHGAIPKEQTRAFHNACDIALVPLAPFPILRETVPSKLFEIMACERPLVACLAGEGAAIVERSRGGVVVEPGSPEALAAALRRLVARPPAEMEEMGSRGRAYVAAHYSREVLAARYLRILERVALSG
jgi:colanic acid biosynthesis glycosyl transferase WcaI